MARQVTASVYCAGELLVPAADIRYLALHQDLFGHHTFEIAVPFDHVEGPQEAFFSQAHKRLLGQPISIELTAELFHFNQGQTFTFKGLITNLSTSKDTDYIGSIVARGYSPDYLLTDGLKRQTFVKQTLATIFNKILQTYPANLLKHTVKPLHTAPIPFAVQYDETNFDFLSRLATEYGEWFYYDGETLTLGAPASSKEEEFAADGAYNNFAFGMALKPAKVKMYEYSYQKNEQFRSSTTSQQVAGIQGHPFGQFALEKSEDLFANEVHLSAEMLIASASELDEEAKLLKGNTAAELITFEGNSDNLLLRLGGIINVSGEGLGSRHITPESFGKYRITRISHSVDQAGNYRNSFTAIPHFLDVPPIRPGYGPPQGMPELAEVIDDADPQKLGRLKVRYYWPVDNPREAETDWIRLLTPYSGSGKGQLFKPEIGSQVLVGYQNGLAEQPFVLGNMFHAKNKQQAKYSPEGNLMKGIQTAGGNKFVMQDKQGQQSILISNSNNKGTALNINFNSDGSITLITSGTITLEAGDKGEIKMHAKNITMEAEEEIKITSKNKSIALQAKENVSTAAEQKVDMTSKDTSINADNAMQITASTSLDVSGGSKANISSGRTRIH